MLCYFTQGTNSTYKFVCRFIHSNRSGRRPCLDCVSLLIVQLSIHLKTKHLVQYLTFLPCWAFRRTSHLPFWPRSQSESVPSNNYDICPTKDWLIRFQASLRSFYAIYNTVPITFEVSRLTAKGGHAHIQIVPIPKRIKVKEIEGAFEQAGIKWEEATSEDLKNPDFPSYFRVELPSGKNLIHYTRPGTSFDVQFGR